MANFLIVSHWTTGDVFPFVKIGLMLKKQGHDVTIFTHCIFEKSIKEKQLGFVAVDNGEEYKELLVDFPVMADAANNLDGVIAFQKKYHGVDRLLREYNLILPYCNREDTVLIFRHRSSVSAMLIAESLGLPSVNVILAPNYLAHMDFHEEIMGRSMCDEINKTREILSLPLIESWTEWMCSSDGMIGLWPSWFAPKENTWPEKLQVAGFPQNDDSENDGFEEISHFIKKYRKVVLVTGGTSYMISKEFYEVSIKACQMAQVGCILVIPFEELVPDEIPENTLLVKNLNIRMAFRQVDAVIHHGGMGTLSEALYNKVPQVILPHFVDRPENAQRLMSLGLVKSFPPKKWQPERIAVAIKEITSKDYSDAYRDKVDYYNLNNDFLIDYLTGFIPAGNKSGSERP